MGANTWTVRANSGGIRTPRSTPITITRLPSPLAAPTITGPTGNSALTEPWAEISGTSEPSTTLKLYSGHNVMARLVVNETGTFTVRIPIKPGTNVIYAETTRGQITRRSAVLILSYATPGLAGGLTQRALAAGQAVIGSVLGAAIFIAQATADLVNRVSSSPALMMLVLGLALVTLTFSQGLAGFELIIMLLPFIRWWWRLIEQPAAAHEIVTIIDAVTGRPVPFVLATIKGARSYSIISDFAGHLHLPVRLINGEFKLSRPGYHPLGLTGKQIVALEPVPGTTSLRALILDTILGLLAWLLLVLATLTTFVLALSRPSLPASLLAIAFAVMLVVNVLLLASRPRIKWGHLTDHTTGRPLTNAAIELQSADGQTISRYQTRADGRYTLHAPVGEYDLVVTSAGRQPYREHLSIRWHEAYLGFNLKL